MAGVVRKTYENTELKLGHNIQLPGVATVKVVYGDLLEYDSAAKKWKKITGTPAGAVGVAASEAEAGKAVSVIVTGVINENALAIKLTDVNLGLLMKSGLFVARNI